MITTIIIFVIILGVLVFVHELGHFIVARRSGMKVDEFGFGFPPRMVGIQRVDGTLRWVWGHKPPLDPEATVYSINWIPLGGFVKILGENNEGEDNPRSFINKGFWPRFFTLVAGVVMNVILAWALVSGGYIFGGLPAAVEKPQDVPAYGTLHNPHVEIVEVSQGQPADQAGIRPGDKILSVDGQEFSVGFSASNVRQYIQANAGKSLTFHVQRGSEQKDVSVQSRSNPPPDQGPTGIVVADVGNLSFPWYIAPLRGAETVFYQIEGIYSGLWQLVTAKLGLQSLGGPVKIAQLTGQVAGLGFIYLLQFTSFLSLNLAVLNILPFPALDGGRVVFLIIEKIRGKKNNQRVEQFVNTAGFLALLLLMVLVTIKDVVKG